MVRRTTVGVSVLLVLLVAFAPPASARRYSAPTYSSPISLSADGKWVWSVNPGAGNVSVIYTKTNKVVATIKVGDEPQSVALDPNNRYAYVANAGSGTVTVIRITRASAKRFRARVDRRARHDQNRRRAVEHRHLAERPAGVRREQRPGHDHGDRREGPRASKVIGHVNLQSSRCDDPSIATGTSSPAGSR